MVALSHVNGGGEFVTTEAGKPAGPVLRSHGGTSYSVVYTKVARERNVVLSKIIRSTFTHASRAVSHLDYQARMDEEIPYGLTVSVDCTV